MKNVHNKFKEQVKYKSKKIFSKYQLLLPLNKCTRFRGLFNTTTLVRYIIIASFGIQLYTTIILIYFSTINHEVYRIKFVTSRLLVNKIFIFCVMENRSNIYDRKNNPKVVGHNLVCE